MYSTLCVNINEWFRTHNEDKGTFRRILVNQCQTTFESCLNCDDQKVSKSQMLGNVKFVGNLLNKGMLATKVLINISQRLLDACTNDSVQALIVLLTTVGSNFDNPKWPHHCELCSIFVTVKQMRQQQQDATFTVEPRIKYLIQDLLELRARGWNSRA